jgi:hypothetical protein
LSGCDLENYLFPLFGRQRLPAERFVLVSARKQLGDSSRIRIGYPVSAAPLSEGWNSDFVSAGAGSTTKAWKERIRDGLAIRAQQLESGPVAVQIAYCCSSNRNWTGLWKPSGDAMGPILGTTRNQGFNPCDDRITELKLHKLIDESLRHDVRLRYWWRKC